MGTECLSYERCESITDFVKVFVLHTSIYIRCPDVTWSWIINELTQTLNYSSAGSAGSISAAELPDPREGVEGSASVWMRISYSLKTLNGKPPGDEIIGVATVAGSRRCGDVMSRSNHHYHRV